MIRINLMDSSIKKSKPRIHLDSFHGLFEGAAILISMMITSLGLGGAIFFLGIYLAFLFNYDLAKAGLVSFASITYFLAFFTLLLKMMSKKKR